MVSFWATLLSALKALSTFAGLIRDFFSWKKSADDRKAGGDAAIVEGQKLEDESLQATRDAADEARDRHKVDPTDDAFKNTDFRD